MSIVATRSNKMEFVKTKENSKEKLAYLAAFFCRHFSKTIHTRLTKDDTSGLARRKRLPAKSIGTYLWEEKLSRTEILKMMHKVFRCFEARKHLVMLYGDRSDQYWSHKVSPVSLLTTNNEESHVVLK